MEIVIPTFRNKSACERWGRSNGSKGVEAFIVADRFGCVAVQDSIKKCQGCANLSAFGTGILSLDLVYDNFGGFVCVNRDLILYIKLRGDERNGIFWVNGKMLCWQGSGGIVRVYPAVLNVLYDSSLSVVKNTTPAIVISQTGYGDRVFNMNEIDIADWNGTFSAKVSDDVSYSEVIKILM